MQLSACPVLAARYFLQPHGLSTHNPYQTGISWVSLSASFRTRSMCSLQDLLKITKSSRYGAMCISRPTSSWSISCWNIAGAPCRPEGIMWNWYRPNPVVKAVFAQDYSATGTCQYPWGRFNVVTNSAWLRLLINSSILGMA